MKVTSNTLVYLEPSEGMVLTNGFFYSESKICLAREDKPENYYEITLEEYSEILKQMEEDTE